MSDFGETESSASSSWTSRSVVVNSGRTVYQVRPVLRDGGTVQRPGPEGDAFGSGTELCTVPSGGTSAYAEIGAQLWSLLHLDRASAAIQSQHGDYRGPRRPISRAVLMRHLTGEVAVAISTLSSKRALFAAVDIDALFMECLPVIRENFEDLGGEDLVAAAFATTGSDEGRGKVVVCLREPAARNFANKLALSALQAIRSAPCGKLLDSRELTIFPQRGSGGVVRILGRNIARKGPFEQVLTLNGDAGDLSTVRPLTRDGIASVAMRVHRQLPKWLQRLLQIPWKAQDGTRVHFRWLVAIAREALHRNGEVRGYKVYVSWIEQVKRNSPELAERSITNRDPRNVCERGRDTAWKRALIEPVTWHAQDVDCMPHSVAKVYAMLERFVQNNGLLPHIFALDYENIAGQMSVSKSTAHRRVVQAEKLGLIVRHDRGFQDELGIRGAATLFGLVGRDETQAAVLAKAAKDYRVRQRLEERQSRKR